MKRYVNATISRRLGAFLLDIFTIILTATILYTLIGRMLVKTDTFSEATKIMNEMKVDSHLYVYDKDDQNITHEIKNEDYPEAIKYFYIEYKENSEEYFKLMNESNLFDYNEGTYTKKEDVSEESFSKFYNELYASCIVEITQSEEYQYCYRVNMNFVLYNIIISFLLSYLCFIVLIPVLTKRKTTIGQKIMNIAIVNNDDNEFASNTQIVFRAIIILLVEVILSLFSMGVPLFISVGFIIFRSDHASYHDLLSSTRMIDYHYVEIDDTRNKGNN